MKGTNGTRVERGSLGPWQNGLENMREGEQRSDESLAEMKEMRN